MNHNETKVSVEMTEADFREYQALKEKKAKAEAKERAAHEHQEARGKHKSR